MTASPNDVRFANDVWLRHILWQTSHHCYERRRKLFHLQMSLRGRAKPWRGCAFVSDEGALQMRCTPCGCNPFPPAVPIIRGSAKRRTDCHTSLRTGSQWHGTPFLPAVYAWERNNAAFLFVYSGVLTRVDCKKRLALRKSLFAWHPRRDSNSLPYA